VTLWLLNESGKRSKVDLDEVLLIMTTKSGPCFVTAEGEYRLPVTVAQMAEVYGQLGYEQVDRHLLANLRRAEWFDAEERKLYFGRGLTEEERLYATVSAANSWKLRHLIRESTEAVQMYDCAARGRADQIGTLKEIEAFVL